MGRDEGDRRARHGRSAVVGLVDVVIVVRDCLYVGDVGLEARDTSGGALTRRWASEVNHQCSLKRAWHYKHVDWAER